MTDIPTLTLRLLLNQNHPELSHLLPDVEEWIRAHQVKPEDEFDHLHEPEYVILARSLMAHGRYVQVIPLLQRLTEAAEAGGRKGDLIQYLVLQALAQYEQKQTTVTTVAALTTFTQALTLAEPEGYIRTFVDHGPPMQRLLQKAATQNIAPAYVSRLLSAFVEASPLDVSTSLTISSASPLIEPLNDREMDVLRLMVTDLSNREIADELSLAVTTIKWYARTIYGKLAVNKRSQAVSRARELGIL